MAWVFNGTTSKAEHTTASGLDSSVYSILYWIYLTSFGETPSYGLVMDESANSFLARHNNSSSRLQFQAKFDTTNGLWNAPASSLQTSGWNVVAITYDRSSTANDPVFYIRKVGTDANLVAVTVTEATAPVGTAVTANTGYCIGNATGAANTTDGRMAYVQYWNRVLTYGELQTAMHFPGRVRNGLKLFVPCTSETTAELSGNNQAPTLTSISYGDNPPCSPMWAGLGGWFGARTAAGSNYNQAVSGGLTPAGVLINRTGKPLAGSVSPVGTLTNRAGKPLAGGITPTGVVVNRTGKPLGGTLAPTGTLVLAARKIVAGTLTSAGALVLRTAKILDGALSPSGEVAKRIGKPLGGTLTPDGALTAIRTALIALGGTLTTAGTLILSSRKVVAGGLAPTGDVVRATRKALSGLLTTSGEVAKRTAKALSGVLTTAGDVVASLGASTFYGPGTRIRRRVIGVVAYATRRFRPKAKRDDTLADG